MCHKQSSTTPASQQMPPFERAPSFHQQQHNAMPLSNRIKLPPYLLEARHIYTTRFVRASVFLLAFISVYTSNYMMRSNVSLSVDEDSLNQPENCDTTVPSSQPRLRRPSKKHQDMERVGTFNYMDLYYVQRPLPRTKIHCAGENYRPNTSFYYRQCEYQNLCFDLETLEFVIYKDSLQKTLPKEWLSSTIRNMDDPIKNLEVSALTPDFKLPFDEDYIKVFSPTVRNETPPSQYYYLDVAMIPYYRYHYGWKNPGEMGWQDLLPIWQLIEGFGREDETILLDPLWHSYRTSLHREGMADMMIKMGAKLMGMPSYVDLMNPFWEDGEFEINITSSDHQKLLDLNMTRPQPKLICPKLTLTGNGMAGEHAAHRYNTSHVQGEILHEDENILPVHHGAGGKFKRWRSWMMKNIGVEDVDPEVLESKPSEILLFFNTSKHKGRNNVRKALRSLSNSIEQSFSANDVRVEKHDMADYTIEEQVRMLSRTKVVMSVVGGGTFPCIFLPPGSHLILFFDNRFHKGGLYDWDYWNNMPHIKTHWIPIKPYLKETYYHGELLLLLEEIIDTPIENRTVMNSTRASWDVPSSEDPLDMSVAGGVTVTQHGSNEVSMFRQSSSQ